MNGNFEPLEEYKGDIIRIDRLIEFLPEEYWSWDENEREKINLDDISIAIHEAQLEISEPYGDTWKHPVLEHKNKDWHIGRIIYFINHAGEIKDVEIDNPCSGGFILPAPIIVDGWHRWAAARWLYDQERLSEIHCRYGGRVDVLEYLQGKTDELLLEII